MMVKKKNEKYVVAGLFFGLAAAAYYTLANFGSILFESSIIVSLFNSIGAPIGIIAAGLLSIFGIMVILLDVKDFIKFAQGAGILVLTLIWVLFPDFIPGPVDDIIVSIIGGYTGVHLIRASN